jgi:hypothetical protein
VPFQLSEHPSDAEASVARFGLPEQEAIRIPPVS